ncbi:hypothetical protein MBH78_07160 [Oceanimonas sp. NS1]|nr:hypothetical protein [Oceanimonas sp. NS1]
MTEKCALADAGLDESHVAEYLASQPDFLPVIPGCSIPCVCPTSSAAACRWWKPAWSVSGCAFISWRKKLLS